MRRPPRVLPTPQTSSTYGAGLPETDENGHESKIPRYKLTQASNKRFSFLLNSTYGGKTFKLNDGRTVKWDSRGKKRSKKYTFQIS